MCVPRSVFDHHHRMMLARLAMYVCIKAVSAELAWPSLVVRSDSNVTPALIHHARATPSFHPPPRFSFLFIYFCRSS